MRPQAPVQAPAIVDLASLRWSDPIEEFLALTEGEMSPQQFRLWAGIALVGGCAERRVWAKLGTRTSYPNFFLMLVGHPGVGKMVIELVRGLWDQVAEPGTGVKLLHVAPDSMTKASLVDELVTAKRSWFPPGEAQLQTYHSLAVPAEEAGVLLPAYDLEFIGTLNSLFNNKSRHVETRRTSKVKLVDIDRPQLNLLMGAQPGWLASVFPEEAWSTGLTSRMIMIYADETPLVDPFWEPPDVADIERRLLTRLGELAVLSGQMKWTPEAAERYRDWYMSGGLPAPSHSKLVHYTRRRGLHLSKLVMVSALARTGRLVIELCDILRGIDWLLEAEALMPDIFRAMVGKSDAQVLEELHYFLLAQWGAKRKPQHESVLVHFLSQRVPSEKVQRLLDVALRANIITRLAGTETYLPRPRGEHGVE